MALELVRPLPADDDESLVKHIREGNPAAFERLMRKYNRRLFRLARAVLSDDAEAEDALQEAYLQAYRSIAQFRGEAALSTWLSRLVLNESLGRRRRATRRENIVPLASSDSETELTSMAAEDSLSPDRAAARLEMRAILERKLDELPVQYRTVFVLRSVEEMTPEEAAQCLGLPVATVRTRHFRARGLLREALARELDIAERDLFDIGGSHCDRIVRGVLARLGSR